MSEIYLLIDGIIYCQPTLQIHQCANITLTLKVEYLPIHDQSNVYRGLQQYCLIISK